MSSTKGLIQGLVVGTLLGVAALWLGGCNTVEGFGQDISAAGQGLSDVAADVNPANN